MVLEVDRVSHALWDPLSNRVSTFTTCGSIWHEWQSGMTREHTGDGWEFRGWIRGYEDNPTCLACLSRIR